MNALSSAGKSECKEVDKKIHIMNSSVLFSEFGGRYQISKAFYFFQNLKVDETNYFWLAFKGISWTWQKIKLEDCKWLAIWMVNRDDRVHISQSCVLSQLTRSGYCNFYKNLMRWWESCYIPYALIDSLYPNQRLIRWWAGCYILMHSLVLFEL